MMSIWHAAACLFLLFESKERRHRPKRLLSKDIHLHANQPKGREWEGEVGWGSKLGSGAARLIGGFNQHGRCKKVGAQSGDTVAANSDGGPLAYCVLDLCFDLRNGPLINQRAYIDARLRAWPLWARATPSARAQVGLTPAKLAIRL